MSIGVVLNVYKRPENVLRQLQALSIQSVLPETVMIWVNGCDFELPKNYSSHYHFNILLIRSSTNLGVWARFIAALNLHTEYVNIMDDDIIPGIDWLKHARSNCINLNGIIGGRGVRFYKRNSYNPLDHWGWKNPNEKPMEVDILGHSWFFRREWLNEIWSIKWNENFFTSGEDMNLSFKILMNLNINSYVAPHPIDDKACWSNIDGDKIGSDFAAISRGKQAYKKFDASLNYFTSNKSLKLFYERNDEQKSQHILYQSSLFRRLGFASILKKILGESRYVSLGRKLKKKGIHL